jgi:hypothetical protein
MRFRLKLQVERTGDSRQSLVSRPDPSRACQGGRSQQMNVDVTDAASHELMPVDKVQSLVLRRNRSRWKVAQQGENLLSVLEAAAGKFADHEWVHQDLFGIQRRDKPWFRSAKVVDPD